MSRKAITFALAVRRGKIKLSDVPVPYRDRAGFLAKTADESYLREYADTVAPPEPQRNARLSRSG